MSFDLRSLQGPYHCLRLEWHGDVCVVTLQGSSLDDLWVEEMGRELHDLIQRDGCRKLVLRLGDINCLYSVLLGKLLTIRRLMRSFNGRLKLCETPPHVAEVFHVCRLERYFEFVPTQEEAVVGPW